MLESDWRLSVRNALVERAIFTNRPVSRSNMRFFLILGLVARFVFAFEWETLFPNICFLPVSAHIAIAYSHKSSLLPCPSTALFWLSQGRVVRF